MTDSVSEAVVHKLQTVKPYKKRELLPAWNHLLVLPDPSEDQFQGSILLPGQRQTHTGVVIAAGPGLYDGDGILQPSPFKAGHRILYFAPLSEKNAPQYPEVSDGVETYLMMTAADVMATVNLLPPPE